MEYFRLAATLEYTSLQPDVAPTAIEKLCDEALSNNLYGVCIPPYYVKSVADRLKKASKLITVVGFPFGYNAVIAKVEEAKRAIDEGADEIDALINLSAATANDRFYLDNEINSLATACAMRGKVLKLILEPSLLDPLLLEHLCRSCVSSDIPFVKTNTGFLGHQADTATVRKLRALLPASVKIKAAGGIRTMAQAEALLEAGAVRLGTSMALAILKP